MRNRHRGGAAKKAKDDLPVAQVKQMLQSLLRDRFKLVTHIEQRETSFLALVRARANGSLGPGLITMNECSSAIVNELRQKFPEKYPSPMGGGMISGCSSAGLGGVADLLSTGQDTPVIDATGLKDSFYYILRSQFSLAAALLGGPSRTENDPHLPALPTALEEQLGLKLEPRRGPIDVLVIDSVERPTPD